ncbi:hypothetical protein BS47DRAFT_1399485 [Hydnum rufescens UP504]|uniref:Uncharacterized protein n=1 Tax=Hydnum rufescens UP504 TaxID=1448309 RepID=A0A9P6AIJ0_9AGAM|nr:hypothetical protein BS47DRAFT_1399485 [Hydnum rufescens UP504]
MSSSFPEVGTLRPCHHLLVHPDSNTVLTVSIQGKDLLDEVDEGERKTAKRMADRKGEWQIAKVNRQIAKANGQIAKMNERIAKANGRMAKANGQTAKANGQMAKANGQVTRAH